MRIKFYLTQSGRSPVEEFLKELSLEVRENFLEALIFLENNQFLDMPLSRSLNSIHKGLHELRLKDRYGAYRFFYYIKKEDGVYFVHALIKKTQELPIKDIRLALKRIKEI